MDGTTSPDAFRIELDGRWSLADFSEYTRVFNQAYALTLAILDVDGVLDSERRERAFGAHEWRGAGFSAANFYREVRMLVPPPLRARIQSLQYASPGWMDLALLTSAAVSLNVIVKRVVNTFQAMTDYYDRLYKQLAERKLTRIKTMEEEIRLVREHKDFLQASAAQFAELLGVSRIADVERVTANPLYTLKILLGYFRYVRVLARRELEGKAKLPQLSEEASPAAENLVIREIETPNSVGPSSSDAGPSEPV